MENNLIYIVIASMGLNAILMVAVLVFAYKLLKKNEMLMAMNSQVDSLGEDYIKRKQSQIENNNKAQQNFFQEKVETYTRAESIGDYCVDHSTEVSVGSCAISALPYCEHCLKTFQN